MQPKKTLNKILSLADAAPDDFCRSEVMRLARRFDIGSAQPNEAKALKAVRSGCRTISEISDVCGWDKMTTVLMLNKLAAEKKIRRQKTSVEVFNYLPVNQEVK